MDILIKTIVDFTPMLLVVLAVLAFINIFILVVTNGEESTNRSKKYVRPTMDMVRSTRFMSLE